jgi:parvulin-like peptidyl-prolyl isomerase
MKSFLSFTILCVTLFTSASTNPALAQNNTKPTGAEKQALKEANEIYEKLQRGEDFAVLARTYSDDPGSAKHGGNLGWAKKGTMVPEFETAALKLQPGQISRPVRSDFGYHLIQLLQQKGDEYESRHILIRVAP